MAFSKRGLIILFLLLLPAVHASLTIDPFFVPTRNLGDHFLLSGAVTHDTALRGQVLLRFLCEQGNSTAATLLVDISPGQATPFSSLVTIPDSLLGSCVVRADLLDPQSQSIDNTLSDSFIVTNDLRGSLEPVLPSYQLSEKLNLKGTFSKADGTSVQGSALIYYKRNGDTTFLESVPIDAGVLTYTKDLSLLPPGTYTLSIHVSDAFQNKHIFQDFASFSLANSLTLSVHPDKEVYNPGDSVVLRGSVQGKTGNVLTNVKILGTAFDKPLSATLPSSNDAFTISFSLPKDVKSGDHQLFLASKDEKGNYGESFVTYTVRSIPTTLKLTLNGTAFLPQQEVHFTLDLRDQASDAMSDSVLVSLFDQAGTFEKSKLVKAGIDDYFVLPPGGLPGSWKLKADGLGLQTEQSFSMQDQQLLTTSLNQGVLSVHNIGNVPFNGYFSIKADTLERGDTADLGLNESTDFTLNKYFPAGTYTLFIPLTNQTYPNVEVTERTTIFSALKDSFDGLGKSFDGITGKVTARVSSSTQNPNRQLALYGLLVLILGVLVFMLWHHRKEKTVNHVFQQNRDQDYKEGRKMLAELQRRGIRKPTERFGVADEKDVQDFKDRMSTAYTQHMQNEKKNKASDGEYPTLRPRRPVASPTPSQPVRSSGSSSSSSSTSSGAGSSSASSEGNIFDMFK